MEDHGVTDKAADSKSRIYQKNMEAARRFFPGIEDRIAGVAAAEIAVETAASGEPTARLGGLYLHSARDPVREAARLVTADATKPEVFVLLGFALGYTAEAAAALPTRPPVA